MYYEEDNIQMACVEHFKWRYSKYFRLLFHPQNEGDGNKKKGRRMKAMGVQPGVADLILMVPRNGYHGLCLEAKSRRGRQMDSQKDWQRWVEEQGYRYEIFRSLDEFMAICHDYLGPEEDPNVEVLNKITQFDNDKSE